LGEPFVSWRAKPEDKGDPVDQTALAWREDDLPEASLKKGHKERGVVTRYRWTSGSTGSREGQMAVVAEHSTDEGGEVRPKRPTGGKARSGITFDWKER
jgi:hypothetical protein